MRFINVCLLLLLLINAECDCGYFFQQLFIMTQKLISATINTQALIHDQLQS